MTDPHTEAYELREIAGDAANPSRPPDLLIEIPHGATRRQDYEALERRLKSALPADLIDFFFVNTDAGAPELAEALARRLVEADPAKKVRILTARVPRTFIDLNRVLDQSPESYREGKVTPGIPPWIRDPDDQELLRGLLRAYAAEAALSFEEICGAGGLALMLHTYAPRSVDVQVDEDIVRALHRAYAEEVVHTWPLRPEVDIIGRDMEGRLLAPQGLVDAVVAACRRADLHATVGGTYPLHPSTAAFHLAARHPGRTLCVEVRRDLLADPFTPFEQMRIGEVKVARVAGALVEALLLAWGYVSLPDSAR